jgi:tRNA-2-methylthio-N6-dimethylallyladenosine synthase
MNKAESESILMSLAAAGWTEGESESDADLVILNTCSVRTTAEERIRGRLGHYRHAKKSRLFTLVLTGCMAERLKERIIDEHPEVDVVVGTFNKKNLVGAVREARATKTRVVSTRRTTYDFAESHSASGSKAFVPIMHGCDNWCTYCVVPSVRGPEVSRPPDEILAEISRLEGRGVREATLLGQNVNSYRWRASEGLLSFPDLLRKVAERTRSIRWLRFLTSHPKDLSESLLEVMARTPVLCRHIHLPLQSGSSRVLGLMNRDYTGEQYLGLVRRVRAALSGVSITTDILIGFPGESDADFAETLDLMREARFDDAFTYHYNPREGTRAFSMPGAVAADVKRQRLDRVIETQRAIGQGRAAERIGNEVDVLVEGVSKKDPGELLARTEWDAMVVFPGHRSMVGEFQRVRLVSISGSTFRAECL